MLHVHFKSYGNYITDSLYQWDLNQDLIINGLNLGVRPEIHFANANMEREIVRQSTVENGIIIARIPNSLLQAALTIKAYIGLYEGETFRTVEIVEIPVIAREKPLDYTIADDEEIYSFNAMENKLDNAVTDITARYNEAVTALEEYKNWIANSNVDTSGKIDRVSGATVNNIVIFDENGGIKDSGETISSLAAKIADEIAGGAW